MTFQNNGHDEEPKKQWRGNFVPPEALLAFEDGRIKPFDFILLIEIESLVSIEKGCCASNEFLAIKMRSKPDTVCRAIARLKHGGWIVEVGFNGRIRVLETCWSRVDPKRLKLKHFNVNRKRLKDRRIDSDESRLGQKSETRLGQKSELDSDKNPSPNRVAREETRKKRAVPNGTGRAKPAAPQMNGFFVDAFHVAQAGRLFATLLKNNSKLAKGIRGKQKPVEKKTLAVLFARIEYEHPSSRDEIADVVSFLEDNYSKEYVPKLYRVDDLRTKWENLLDARSRWAADQARENGGELPKSKTEQDREKLVSRVKGRVSKMLNDRGVNPFTTQIWQKEVDEALIDLGLEKGLVSWKELR